MSYGCRPGPGRKPSRIPTQERAARGASLLTASTPTTAPPQPPRDVEPRATIEAPGCIQQCQVLLNRASSFLSHGAHRLSATHIASLSIATCPLLPSCCLPVYSTPTRPTSRCSADRAHAYAPVPHAHVRATTDDTQGEWIPTEGQWPVDPQEDVQVSEQRIWVDGCFDFAHHGRPTSASDMLSAYT